MAEALAPWPAASRSSGIAGSRDAAGWDADPGAPAAERRQHSARVERWRTVTYYHVELDLHDVLLAEGAAAESYLDTGNRDTFGNADGPITLHPDMSDGQQRREAEILCPVCR